MVVTLGLLVFIYDRGIHGIHNFYKIMLHCYTNDIIILILIRLYSVAFY